MSDFFERRARVTIGPLAGFGVEITDQFRIRFSVDLSDSSEGNHISAEIYNLNENTRKQIRQENNLVLIEAGYATSFETLATGQIIADNGVRIKREPPDTIISIEAMDGTRDLNEKKISLSFEQGYPVSEALSKAARLAGLPLRFGPGIFITDSYRQGSAFSGTAKSVIDQIMDRLDDLSWTVQNNEIVVFKKGVAVDLTLVTLSSRTGMIHAPEQFQGKKSGWNVTSLLNPKLRPGVSVLLQSSLVTGQFIVQKVTHRGDTRGNDWTSVASLIEPESVI